MKKQPVALGLLALFAVVVFATDLYLLPDVFMPAVAYMLAVLLAAFFMPGPRWVAAVAAWTLVLQCAAYWLQEPRLSLLPASYVGGLGVVSLLCVVLSNRASREAALRREAESQRARAEHAQSQAEKGWRLLLDNELRLKRSQEIAHLGSWELDLRTGDLSWSDEVYRIFGLKPREFEATYEAFLEAVHPEDRAAVDAAYSDSVREGRNSYEIEHRVVQRSSGEVRHVHEKCEHVRDETGMIIRSVGMVHDITERKLAERERERLLEEVERRSAELDAAFSSSADGMLICNSAGEIVLMNHAFRRMLGYTEEERSLPMDRRAALLRMETPAGKPLSFQEQPLPRALRGETTLGLIVVVRPPHGRVLWTSISGAPLYNPAGKLLGAVLTITDITPIQELQQQRAKHVLAISHGLRTPLTIIQGHAQMMVKVLSHEAGGDRLSRSAEEIVASSRKMSLGLRDLVDLTSLENGEPIMLNREPLDVCSLLLGLKRRLSGVIDTSRVQVDVPECAALVSADLDRLERVLVGLLSNALKYSDPSSEVLVGLTIQEGDAVISVSDRGKGMTREEIAHIFEPYRRSEGRQENVGLGLYVAKGLVEAMGGRLWVDTRLGRGSTFSFSLPVT